MKAGIITFHSAHNFGASLQVYAMKTYLQKNGWEAEVVNYRPAVIDNPYRLKSRAEEKKAGTFDGLRGKRLRYAKRAKKARFAHFETFLSETLGVGEKYPNLKRLREAKLSYDALIAGSDQIWNGTILKDMDAAYFGAFGEKQMQRIAYAASIGTDTLPRDSEDFFVRYLQCFDAISVREESARRLIAPYTDQPISVVVDPTLLISRDDFDKICAPPLYSEPYVLLHNVHIKGEYEALNGMAETVAKQLSLPIVKNRDEKLFERELAPFTGGGPREFLSLIRNAAYVVTDSFHATVFSILYHKPFITVPPVKRPDRLVHLLGALSLSAHLIDSKRALPPLSELEIEYAKVDESILRLRTSSEAFLQSALRGASVTEAAEGAATGAATGAADKAEQAAITRTRLNQFRCAGCGLCITDGASSLVPDEEGFLYPQGANGCARTDAAARADGAGEKAGTDSADGNAGTDGVGERASQAAYPLLLVRNRDRLTIMRHTFGAVLPVLAEDCFANGGVVVKAGVTAQGGYAFQVYETMEACGRFLETEYFEAEEGGVRRDIAALLRANRRVLFCGAGCDIAALRQFLAQEVLTEPQMELLCCVSLSCGGKMPYALMKEYAEQLTGGRPIAEISMHVKSYGKAKARMGVRLADGSSRFFEYAENELLQAYQEQLVQRPFCYTCGEQASCAEITLYGISPDKDVAQKLPERGVTLVQLCSARGAALFERVKERFVTETVSEKQAEGLCAPAPLLTTGRSRFFRLKQEQGLSAALKRVLK